MELTKSLGGQWWCDGMLVENLTEWLEALPPETKLIVETPLELFAYLTREEE